MSRGQSRRIKEIEGWFREQVFPDLKAQPILGGVVEDCWHVAFPSMNQVNLSIRAEAKRLERLRLCDFVAASEYGVCGPYAYLDRLKMYEQRLRLHERLDSGLRTCQPSVSDGSVRRSTVGQHTNRELQRCSLQWNVARNARSGTYSHRKFLTSVVDPFQLFFVRVSDRCYRKCSKLFSLSSITPSEHLFL